MSARTPTEVYLCVNTPGTGAPLYQNYKRGLLKFTDLTVNSNIQWSIVGAPWTSLSQLKITAVTPHETDST
jgi:hypothetical protein